MWKLRDLLFRKKTVPAKFEAKTSEAGDDFLSMRSLAKYSYEIMEKLSLCGPRAAGSKESRRAAVMIAGLFEDLGLEASLKEFDLIPSLGRLWPKACAVSIPSSFVLMIAGLPYVALPLVVFSFVFVYFDGVLGRPLVKRLRKKGKGANVEARLEPVGEVRQTVILSAHHDSAPLFTRKKHKADFVLPFVSCIYSMFLSFSLSIAELVGGKLLRFNLPSLFGFLAISIGVVLSLSSLKLWTLYSSEFSPGVGDNLSGEAVLISLAKYFSRKKTASTRLVFASFDAEEIGHQGARDYFSSLDLPYDTYVINIDGLYDKDELCFICLDGNGSIKLSDHLSSELVHLSKSLGYSVKQGKLPFLGGSTDACEAARAGFRATSLTGMHPDAETKAHTKDDTMAAVSADTLEETIQIMVKYLERLDARNSGETERDGDEKSRLYAPRRYKLSIYDED